ncbi:hypothetical protein QJS10_CPB20g01347 [Acorus calamus]|uniref:Uncharacterized protein n=1 Tax=Acorus calamus TaxID=4465 RepID=A0AAV9CE27_ACOCL|nr:hypothetical protein QJS10_CPB20g01347 [Acorus calamus]
MLCGGATSKGFNAFGSPRVNKEDHSHSVGDSDDQRLNSNENEQDYMWEGLNENRKNMWGNTNERAFVDLSHSEHGDEGCSNYLAKGSPVVASEAFEEGGSGLSEISKHNKISIQGYPGVYSHSKHGLRA